MEPLCFVRDWLSDWDLLRIFLNLSLETRKASTLPTRLRKYEQKNEKLSVEYLIVWFFYRKLKKMKESSMKNDLSSVLNDILYRPIILSTVQVHFSFKGKKFYNFLNRSQTRIPRYFTSLQLMRHRCRDGSGTVRSQISEGLDEVRKVWSRTGRSKKWRDRQDRAPKKARRENFLASFSFQIIIW